jgi:predicted transcriptional regulator
VAVSNHHAGDRVLRAQYRLTDRDLTLLGWLADHDVLTTDQIAHALYPSLGFAQRRLMKLTQAGVVERFRPHRWDGGSYPFHYVLDQLGVDVVAAQRAEDQLPRRDQARRRRWWLTSRANLPHRLAVNQFFIDLAGHARTHPDTALERWWSSARCQQNGVFAALDGTTDLRIWTATIAADGHGVWTRTSSAAAVGHGVTGAVPVIVRVPFFVEVDLGTEDLPRLVGKLAAYSTWSERTGRVWPVLFWLPSAIRERHLHDRLATTSTGVPVATAVRPNTTTRDRRNAAHGRHDTPEDDPREQDDRRIPTVADGGPAARVWWLHHTRHWLPAHPLGAGRLTLTDLADTVTDHPDLPP